MSMTAGLNTRLTQTRLISSQIMASTLSLNQLWSKLNPTSIHREPLMDLYLVPDSPKNTILLSDNGTAHSRVTTMNSTEGSVAYLQRPSENLEDGLLAEIHTVKGKRTTMLLEGDFMERAVFRTQSTLINFGFLVWSIFVAFERTSNQLLEYRYRNFLTVLVETSKYSFRWQKILLLS